MFHLSLSLFILNPARTSTSVALCYYCNGNSLMLTLSVHERILLSIMTDANKLEISVWPSSHNTLRPPR